MARMQTNNPNTLTQPLWMGDFASRDYLVPAGYRLDAAQFGFYTITAPSGAALGATSITVTALPVAIPSGTVLDWTGTGEFSRLTADAAMGATSLTVEALDAAIEAADTAKYTPAGNNPVTVPSGTVVGRTLAERNAGTNFGPAAATDDEIVLIAFPVFDASVNPDFTAYRPYAGGIVKENFLPEVLAGTMIAGVLTALRSRYNLIRGAA